MAKEVKLLLREDIDDLGTVGELVTVRSGYARNYLLPTGKAFLATPENERIMERKREVLEAAAAEREAEIQVRVQKLGELQLTTVEKADETGSLYGSVSAGVVAELLRTAGVDVVDRDVRLDEPIKQIGAHEIPVHIYGEHYASVRLSVEPDTSE